MSTKTIAAAVAGIAAAAVGAAVLALAALDRDLARAFSGSLFDDEDGTLADTFG